MKINNIIYNVLFIYLRHNLFIEIFKLIFDFYLLCILIISTPTSYIFGIWCTRTYVIILFSARAMNNLLLLSSSFNQCVGSGNYPQFGTLAIPHPAPPILKCQISDKSPINPPAGFIQNSAL